MRARCQVPPITIITGTPVTGSVTIALPDRLPGGHIMLNIGLLGTGGIADHALAPAIELIGGNRIGCGQIGGRVATHGRTRSKAAPISSTARSANRRPHIDMPVGRPSVENPLGTESTGH